jgi:hypothetical protein
MNGKVTNFQTTKIDQQLVTDTNAYATGDVLVATVAVPVLSTTQNVKNLRLRIDQISIIDKDANAGAFDVVIMDANVSLGTVNAAVSISDANALSVVKTIPVSASNYTVLKSADNAIANIEFNPIYVTSTDRNLYIGLISRDSKTYTASALYLRMGVAVLNQDL